ncbi:MAG: hypothetical protein WCH11_03380 [Bdellovibrio sp.]
MTVEYVLLLSLFVLLLMGAIVNGPYQAFDKAGPKLGARVERHLQTGEGFQSTGRSALRWEE